MLTNSTGKPDALRDFKTAPILDAAGQPPLKTILASFDPSPQEIAGGMVDLFGTAHV